MKIKDLTPEIQAIAAQLAADLIRSNVDPKGDNRTEQVERVSETVRIAFEKLFNT